MRFETGLTVWACQFTPKSSYACPALSVAGLAPICARIFKAPLTSMGMGFLIWVLQCLWLFFLSIIAYRVIIVCKHKVYTQSI